MAKYERYAVELNSDPAESPAEDPKRQHNRRVAQELSGDVPQVDRFKKLARELGCDESEDVFDEVLRKLAEVKPLPKHEPKKRRPRE